MFVIDMLAYVFLFVLLVVMTRVQPTKKIAITFDGKRLSGVILRCHSPLGSRVGLLNTPVLNNGDGILLVGVKSIHTKGVHFPIDVIFLDETFKVLKWVENALPGIKKIKGPLGTRYTLELGGGTIASQLEMLHINSSLAITESLQMQVDS